MGARLAGGGLDFADRAGLLAEHGRALVVVGLLELGRPPARSAAVGVLAGAGVGDAVGSTVADAEVVLAGCPPPLSSIAPVNRLTPITIAPMPAAA